MVVIFGSDRGPAKLASLKQEESGLVSNTIGGVRILFDGVPAPLVYASATQCSAIVPYFGTVKTTTHIQVEYQGVRSGPLEVAVAATAPGLFTADFTGQGQGAVLNEDNVTRNSSAAPTRPCSLLILSGTVYGLTVPPVA